jgi:hypothetical protein
LGVMMISSDRTAFDQFKELPAGDPRRIYRDGDFYGFVCVLGGSWTWTVWHKDGRIIDGFRSWKMDAFFACQKAIECIEKAKAAGELKREGGDVGREPPGP